jgi:hypothetical protein
MMAAGQASAREAESFERAKGDFIALPDRAPAIEAMMTLSLHARNRTIRRWAQTWLLENCGMTVVDQEEAAHAAPTAPRSLPRQVRRRTRRA